MLTVHIIVFTGYQKYYADSIADSDAILVGVVVKGVVAGGPETLTVDIAQASGATTALTQDYTITGTLTPVIFF